MSRDRHARFHVLILLVAFGIGLWGQVVAAVAMPMPMPMSQTKLSLAHAMANSGSCPSCPKPRDVPNAPAVAPGCAVAFCSALPAVLSPGPIVAPRGRARFPLIVFAREVGLTICPDLGPPRPIHIT